MRKSFLFFVLIFIFSASFAQDKTAKDFKIEAKAAYDLKDYTTALTAFENAISLYEEAGAPDTSLYFNTGICAIKTKDYEKAFNLFTSSEKLNYKPCKSKYYQAVSLKGQKKSEEMIAIAEDGYDNCVKQKSKFSKLLFGYYQKEGISIYNNASTMLNTTNQYNPSNLDKYNSEMVKVKAEFSKALPILEKAKSYKDDATVNSAIEQAKSVINSK